MNNMIYVFPLELKGPELKPFWVMLALRFFHYLFFEKAIEINASIIVTPPTGVMNMSCLIGMTR